jgi:ABC-2 type transport system ATP-binding protein
MARTEREKIDPTFALQADDGELLADGGMVATACRRNSRRKRTLQATPSLIDLQAPAVGLQPKRTRGLRMNASPVIEVENLVVEYGRGASAVRAVDGLSFSVAQGECVGFIGVNGAGKSTTIKTLMGFMFPRAGRVALFGQSPRSRRSRGDVGYLPEVALYYPFMKARELLGLYGGLHGLSRRELRQRIPELLARVGLEGKDELLLRTFSKGMQQRLGIAQALISQPRALIFDELCSGLDPIGRVDLRRILQDLKQSGCTVFFSSHELSEVESLCDRVLIVDRGKLIAEERDLDRRQAVAGEASLESFFIETVRATREREV